MLLASLHNLQCYLVTKTHLHIYIKQSRPAQLVFWRDLVQISVRTSAILTRVLYGFSQSLQQHSLKQAMTTSSLVLSSSQYIMTLPPPYSALNNLCK